MIDLRDRLAAGEALDYAAIVPRADFDVDAAVEVVRPICDDVASRGVSALRHWSDRFDHVVPERFRVPAAELEAAVEQLDDDVRAAFEVAIDRRRRVAEAERGDVDTAVDARAGGDRHGSG